MMLPTARRSRSCGRALREDRSVSGRTNAFTYSPRSSSFRTSVAPKKPLAPVTNTNGGCFMRGSLTIHQSSARRSKLRAVSFRSFHSLARSLAFPAGFFVALLGWPALAAAQSALPAHAPAGTGQPALSVLPGKGGDVVAASCAASPCSAGAVSLNVPAELRGRPAQAQVLSLGQGRHAVVVTVADGIRTFKAVVVAPLAGGAPKVLFAGLVGLARGEQGERKGALVQVVDAGSGVHRV